MSEPLTFESRPERERNIRLNLSVRMYRIAGFIAALKPAGYDGGHSEALTGAETFAMAMIGGNVIFVGGVYGPSLRDLAERVRSFTAGLALGSPDNRFYQLVHREACSIYGETFQRDFQRLMPRSSLAFPEAGQ